MEGRGLRSGKPLLYHIALLLQHTDGAVKLGFLHENVIRVEGRHGKDVDVMVEQEG